MLFGVLGCEMNKPLECMPPRTAKPGMKGFKRRLSITKLDNMLVPLVIKAQVWGSCEKRRTIHCSRFAGVGSVSGGNDLPVLPILLLKDLPDLQTQVATVHKEKNDVELKFNELQGMVLHRDGKIKLFSRELDRVTKERGEFQKQVLALERDPSP
uniref:Uncharacterized protein n=1 Tax=Tanacetum cinerariifolium TaxID=118510 RepID=A0A699IR00_TANCI|nr:hypothetical protein [Tanacetum cinerariifolium]